MTTTTQSTPLLMTVAEFAKLHGISESTVRKCIAGDSESYPPLSAKRAGNGRIYITTEQAAEWRASFQDA